MKVLFQLRILAILNKYIDPLNRTIPRMEKSKNLFKEKFNFSALKPIISNANA